MKRSTLLRLLCLTVAMPLLLAACTAAPTGDASSALASSKAGGTSPNESSAGDVSLIGDVSETATSPADSSEEMSSDAVTSEASSMLSSEASSTASKTSSAASQTSSMLSSEASSTASKTSSTASKTSSAASQTSSQAVSSAPYTPPADTRVINGKTYTITFKDEFDGTELDSSKWACCPESNRQDVGGKWSDSMVSVKDGCLYLGAAIDSNGTPVSGAIRTMSKWYQVKFSQCKGYFECRAKLQSAPGFWGAFWLMDKNMNDKSVGNGASDGAEIDIFESFSVAQGGINHAIHWDGYGDHHQQNAKQVYNKSLYDGQFHTFGLAWTDTEYIFYIDGKETYRVGNAAVPNIICQNKLYLKLTVEFGSWAGSINKTKLPDAVVVDYVRVYQAQ